MQAYVNNNWLPDYVFSKQFERYFFVNFNDFFDSNRAIKFLSVYCSALRKLKEESFSIFEIDNDAANISILGTYNLHVASPEEMAMEILNAEYGKGIEYYLSIAMIRCLFTTETNQICIYFERDLDGIVIGCPLQCESIFMEKNEVLNIMNLENYIKMLTVFYGSDPDMMSNFRESLLKNYKNKE